MVITKSLLCYTFLGSLNTAPDENGKSIVEQSGAVALINSNFFNSYNAFQHPIDHMIVDGEFLCGSSGISSFGITKNAEILVDRPAPLHPAHPQ